MDRTRALALVAYTALMGSLVTPLYEPLSAGRDDSWAVLALIAAAHLGLGAVLRRAWMLTLPLLVVTAGFVLGGAGGLAWLIVLFGTPLLVGATALGWLLGHVAGRRAVGVAVAAFVIAVAPAAWAVSESTRREQHVSAREQRELPTLAYVLVQDLCFRTDSGSGRLFAEAVEAGRRRARRQFDALARSMRAHPHAVVTARFVPSDAPGTQTQQLTIRELAETHVDGAELDGPPNDTACYRSGRTRLHRLLSKSG